MVSNHSSNLLPTRHGWRAGYVYLIRNGQGHYKIGKSRNPEKRIAHLRTANSSDLQLIHKIATNDACWLEKKLHRIFRDKRIHREWHQLSEDDIGALKNAEQHDRLFVGRERASEESPEPARRRKAMRHTDPEAPADASEKNQHAAALGKLGGKKGGPARSRALSPERRREIARQGGLELQRKRREARQNNSINPPPA